MTKRSFAIHPPPRSNNDEVRHQQNYYTSHANNM
jgi:hypothetical protein